ncbi:MAG: hypothetical protein GEV05_04815 [Betaproteobacteria bacterium]|nr:hypothetical protein [Betaproteobacteria bacterium]
MAKKKVTKKGVEVKDKDANRDPISGAAGAHPVGVGVGAAAGGAAVGAATGTVAGPVGTAVGAAVGAVVGGLAGKSVAEKIDPTVEDAYWRERYVHEPYYEEGRGWDDYAPAYRVGYEGRSRYYTEPRSFEEVERDIEAEYNRRRAANGLSWDKARRPARAAWDRIEHVMPGDADRDGR